MNLYCTFCCVLFSQLPHAGWSCAWSMTNPHQFFVGLSNGTVHQFDTRTPTKAIAILSTTTLGTSPSLSSPNPSINTSTTNDKHNSSSSSSNNNSKATVNSNSPKPKFGRPVHSLGHFSSYFGAENGSSAPKSEVLVYGTMSRVGFWHRNAASSGNSPAPGMENSTPRFWSLSPSNSHSSSNTGNSRPQTPEQTASAFHHVVLSERKACLSVVRRCHFSQCCVHYNQF